MLSSYTRAINKQEHRTGSLFQQNSKAKLLPAKDNNYHFICFQYIHQNPLKAGLCRRMEDWEFSSFSEYLGRRSETLCNQALAKQLLDLPHSKKDFYDQSYQVIQEDLRRAIF